MPAARCARARRRYRWNDPRLNYTVAPGCKLGEKPPPEWMMSPGFVLKIWQPDIYIANAMDERRSFKARFFFFRPRLSPTRAFP